MNRMLKKVSVFVAATAIVVALSSVAQARSPHWRHHHYPTTTTTTSPVVTTTTRPVTTTTQPPTTTTMPVPSAVFVATTGNDITGNGSIANPYATLGKAQLVMRSGGPQITYIRAGTYFPPAVTRNSVSRALDLTAADSGQTWSYYPPDGYNSARLDGGSTNPTSGIQEMIVLDGADNVTIDGLEIQHFRWMGIGIHGGENFYQLFPTNTTSASGNIIHNNIVHDGSYDMSVIFGYGAGAIGGIYNVPDLTISNNVVYNVQAGGVETEAGNPGAGGNITNLLMNNNYIDRACQASEDCGALYVQDTNTTSTNVRIIDNYIHDSGRPTVRARAVYLDDGTSGTLVSGNIASGLFNHAFTIHGGKNNTIRSNIIDQSAGGDQTILLYQGSNGITGMTGNSMTASIVVSRGGGGHYRGATFGAQPLISGGTYYGYGGLAPSSSGTDGLNGDSSPTIRDPQLTCWNYVPKTWGPPGFTVPHAGTVPSSC